MVAVSEITTPRLGITLEGDGGGMGWWRGGGDARREEGRGEGGEGRREDGKILNDSGRRAQDSRHAVKWGSEHRKA